jgi:hypothetical protein
MAMGGFCVSRRRPEIRLKHGVSSRIDACRFLPKLPDATWRFRFFMGVLALRILDANVKIV